MPFSYMFATALNVQVIIPSDICRWVVVDAGRLRLGMTAILNYCMTPSNLLTSSFTEGFDRFSTKRRRAL